MTTTSPRRPLVRTAPNGTRYIAQGDLPSRPRYTSGPVPSQPASEPPTTPESTPKPKARPKPTGNTKRRKLTDDDVRSIRAEYAAGRWNQADLAYIYGVTQNTVQALLCCRTHRHVKPQPDEQES
jgi:hypothetical protein